MDLSKVNLSRFEAQQCCVQNHGFLAEPASQEEHDLIKQHLVISKIYQSTLFMLHRPGKTPSSICLSTIIIRLSS